LTNHRHAARLLLGLCLALPAPGLAQGLAPASPRAELLEAEVDGLLQRLAAATARPVKPPAPDLQETLEPRRTGKPFAGLALEESDLRLQGAPPAVLRRLLLLARARQALGPPLEVELDGPTLRLEVRLFALPPGARPAAGAPEAELARLRDNLVWLERRAQGARRLAVLVGSLVDSEGVRLEKARLARRGLRVEGWALGPAAREGYARLLTRRCKALPHPPALELEGLRVLAWAPAQPAAALQLSGAPLLDVLAWLAPAGGEEYLAVEAVPPVRLSLDLAPPLRGGWLPALFARAGVAAEARDGVWLVPPPGRSASRPASGSARPLDLACLRAPAREVLRMVLGAPHRALVLGPAGARPLGAWLARRPTGRVAALTLDLLGLEAREAPGLTEVAAPGGPPAEAPALAGPVELTAVQAPAAALVAGLLGQAGLVACPPPAEPLPQSFSAHDVDAQALVRALLGALQYRLEADPRGPRLVPRAGPAADPAECAPGPAPAGPTQARLAGLLGRPGQERLALVQEGAELRWLGAGAQLRDGRRIEAVGRRDLRLVGEDGQRERLQPEAAPGLAAARTGASQTRHPLSRLRLVGTLRRPGQPAEALLLAPDGTTFRVRAGAPLGTRCGQVSAVRPGELEVRLGCALDEEPRALVLGLEAP